MTDSTDHHANSSSIDISLGDLIDAFWRQRVAVLLSFVGVGAVGVVLLGVLMVALPSVETTELPFRVTFAGATEGTYPNGMAFQPNDMVAPSVVRPIFDRLDVGRFMTFDELKAALTVTESNHELEQLRREYEAKLSDAKLTQAEREELEKQYSARRTAARTGEFVIQLISGANGTLPREVAETLLPAVLEGWAAEAQNVKGAWLYDVPVPGQGLLSETDLTQEDYLVVVDLLRLTLKRVDLALEALEEIPGANLIRVPGDKGLSIVEARARLEDLRQFKIEPLFAQVYGQGIFRDRGATTRYLEHRLFRLELDAKALAEKSAAIESILERNGRGMRNGTDQPTAGNAVVIPQFGDAFMDRMMEVGAQTADVKFRRQMSREIVKLRNSRIDLELEKNLYQALLKGFSAVEAIAEGAGVSDAGAKTAEQRRAVREAIEQRFTVVTAEVRYLIDQLQGLHQVISEQNLQPQNIFAVTGPLQRTRSNILGLRMILGIIAVFVAAGVGVALLVAWQRERHRVPG